MKTNNLKKLKKENRELKQTLKQRVLELEVASAVLQVVDIENDLPPLLNYFLEFIYHTIQPTSTSCLFILEKNQQWIIKGEPLKKALLKKLKKETLSYYNNLTIEKITEATAPEIQWHNDEERKHKKKNKSAGHFYSRQSVPIYDDGKAIGTIGIFHTSPNQFSSKEKTSLQTVADYISLSLHRLRQSASIENLKKEFILSNINQGVAFVDKFKRSVVYNPAARKILIRSEQKEQYEDLINYLNFDPIEYLENSNRKVTHKTVNINSFPYKLIIYALEDKEKKRFGTMIVVQEISDEIELERMVTEFISIASHELRTPMSVIKSSIELLKMSNLEVNKKTELMGRAESHINRLQSMVTKLSDIYNFEMKKHSISKKKILFNNKIDLNLLPYQKIIKSKEIKWTLEIPDNPVYIRANTEGLNKIFKEILDNAIRATSAKGEIIIRSSINEKHLKVEIQDFGPGIRLEDQKIIFEKFKQSEHYLERTIQGLGLGLPLAKLIVESFGGEIGVQSHPGKGSIFFFTLPLSNKYRILNIGNGNKHLEKALPSHLFQVISSKNSTQIPSHLNKNDFDLIVMSENNEEIIRQLKCSAFLQPVPILYVGNYTCEDRRRQNTLQISLEEHTPENLIEKILPQILEDYEN
ncbi:MAG: GAF domain-containing sensor histidine kinase [Deltaproteobacteria bacterium]|nr:GAF domain-containing sensor histidine kinase [Deltaproteobacteria bacterium]